MIDLTGWKRLECNVLMRFSGVTEGNFNSIHRFRAESVQHDLRFVCFPRVGCVSFASGCQKWSVYREFRLVLPDGHFQQWPSGTHVPA